MGDGWLWVTAHRTGEQGLVFQDLVEHLDETIDPNKVFNWFHDNISKEAAVDLLVKGILLQVYYSNQKIVHLIRILCFLCPQLVQGVFWSVQATTLPATIHCSSTSTTKSSGFASKRKAYAT